LSDKKHIIAADEEHVICGSIQKLVCTCINIGGRERASIFWERKGRYSKETVQEIIYRKVVSCSECHKASF
jgi:hypothetical protein